VEFLQTVAYRRLEVFFQALCPRADRQRVFEQSLRAQFSPDMANYLKRSLVAALWVAAGISGASAQTSAAATSDKPVFQWAGDFRFRYEAYDSAQTLNNAAAFHVRDYFRARLRLWETTTPFPELTLFGRVAAEPRYWFNAASKAAEGEEWKHAIFDNLYAKWTPEAGGMPLTVTVGRQDIQFGDQWVIGDGTPNDGSWTNFYDALRVSIDAKDLKTKFDVIVLNQQALCGDRIPILGSDRKLASLTDQDETGVILYASNKSVKNTQIDGYFIYKSDNSIPQITKGYNADIYTLGSRISGTPAEHWQYTVEGAYQWGRRNDASGSFTAAKNLTAYGSLSRDVSAFGFNAKLTYLFKDSLNNQLSLVSEYLSGDKSGTGKDEMFDMLWGRGPRISEVWAVALPVEVANRGSQWNNLFRIGASWSIAPTKNTSVSATYNALFAIEDSPTRTTSALFSRDSNFRGHLVQVVVKQKFTKQLSGTVLAEYCPMGGYYTHTDDMTFLRAEMLVTF